MRGIAVVVAIVCAGCVEPSLVPCGELECPASEVCTPGGCATVDNVAACTGHVDGDACTFATGGTGTCVGGSCQSGLCGNGVLDPGELCDLGSANGTCLGCSANCQSNETCGNGIVDSECGETCDDQNANAADGCDACKLTAWQATTVIGGNVTATAAVLPAPTDVAIDRSGNLYIADSNQERVFKVSPSGIITTLAGIGTRGSAGDNADATSAELAEPSGIAVDGLGNVFIADLDNCCVRRIDPTGIITTVAGIAFTSGGDFSCADFSGDGGDATNARLGEPTAIAVDGLGNLYIADHDNNRVRRVDPNGVITTIAGTGGSASSGDGGPAVNAQLASPSDVVIDSLGNLYVAEAHRVRRIATNGVIITVAGTGASGSTGDSGPATLATLGGELRLAVTADTLYIADAANNRVRAVDASGIITTVAGTGVIGYGGDGSAATAALLDEPGGLAIDGLGNLEIADTRNSRVRRVAGDGTISTIAGTGVDTQTGNGGAATCAAVGAEGMVTDHLGNLYLASGARILRIDPTDVLTTIAGTGVDGVSGDGGPALDAQLSAAALAFDSAGNLFAADRDHSVVRRIDANGIITTIAGTGTAGYTGDGGAATSAEFRWPDAIAIDGVGNIYIDDQADYVIRRIDPTGVITTFAGNGTSGFSGDGGPAISAELSAISGLAVDGAGNVYFADLFNARIRRIDPTGVITTIAGNGTDGLTGDGGPAIDAELAGPSSLATDSAGNLYEFDNDRVRRIDTAGIITTLAGDGAGSNVPMISSGGHLPFFGDGGSALVMPLWETGAIAVDPAGNLYFAGLGDVRRITPSGIITTFAGQVDPQGMGPLAQAQLADPRALIVASSMTLFAGGNTGTVQAAQDGWLGVVAGRYQQDKPTGALARFRDGTFGTVTGVAYDEAANIIYVSESSSNRLDAITIVDPNDPDTWTIAPLANTAGSAGFADGGAATAQFRGPTGLYLDPLAQQLYVADAGNHAIRAIDLTGGIANATARTFAGTPEMLGYFGDGGPASAALLYKPAAITRCTNGDLFIADAGNNRVRRVAAATGVISTVLGEGTAASSGEGAPASSFPVNNPLGLACDALGNLYVTSTTSVRLVLANANGVVDGTGAVQTIYGGGARDTFPSSVTSCLTGLAVVDATTVRVVDSCVGLLVEVDRVVRTP